VICHTQLLHPESLVAGSPVARLWGQEKQRYRLRTGQMHEKLSASLTVVLLCGADEIDAFFHVGPLSCDGVQMQ